MTFQYFLVVLLVCEALAGVAQHKDRVIDNSLSDQEPGSPDYDHEAFLGKEEAEEFKELSPDESKRRLGIIADKIDKDSDGKVNEKELKDWIVFTQTRYIREDSDKQFESHDTDKDGKIDWAEYKKATYGFLDDQEEEKDDEYDKMIGRDERRFNKADTDGDKALTVEEFRAFLHPEEHDHMKGVVTKETLDEIDKNKDGFVDLDEYIGDMFNPEENEEEPDWVTTEREQFANFRDVNKDGKLDEEEVRAWIMPDDYNHAEAEAKHLIYEADDDKDGELTREEIVAHHDKFVGSQATDWGEALNRHDEF